MASGSDRHSAFLDRVYRTQRHAYDPLRKTFLFGRDRLLERLASDRPERVLELGCGTARNLIQLHRRCPAARLYGLDASAEMLKTARAKLRRRGLAQHIELRHGLAEDVDHRATFGLDERFDAVFFSYSLTMMPAWRRAIDAALANLRPGGRIYIVDFWDQQPWPAPLRALLQARLARYHVRFRPEMLLYLRQLETEGRGTLHVESILYRYAFLAGFAAAARFPGDFRGIASRQPVVAAARVVRH